MRPGLRQKLGLVCSFHTNIFVFDLMDICASIPTASAPICSLGT